MQLYDYFQKIELPAARCFQEMSNRGICIDLPYLQNLKILLEEQKRPLEEEIKNELGPINLNSPKQLLKALNGKEIYPIYKGKGSTDRRALESQRGFSVVKNLLQYSQVDTLLSTFVCQYLERNQAIVHPFFNQCGTRTGRLSCSNPNLLQIPKHTENGKLVRKMFIARPGMLLGDCDYGQIEPRLLAHFSKDSYLCELFTSGFDFHQFTADKLRISRDRAKILNLSVGYRASFKSVSQQLKCTDNEARNEISKWWSLFPQLYKWEEQCIFSAKRSGYCTTLMGRRIKVDNLTDANIYKREHAQRQLINNIIQGSAAEVMKLGMIDVQRDFGFSPLAGLLIQVYDQLVFESPDIENNIEIVKKNMENCIKLEVPLTVDAKIGANWANVQ